MSIVGLVRRRLPLPTPVRIVSRILILLEELELVLLVSLLKYLVVELPGAAFAVPGRSLMMRGRTASSA